MSNGKRLSVNQARPMIRKFITQERQRTGLPESAIVVGQKLDLQLLRDFISGIDALPAENKVDAFRIYFAKSLRPNASQEEYDVVMVPVLENDEDLHSVYRLAGDDDEQTTLIGGGLPCPNVCPRNTLSCTE